jgi:murein L,D-transpeptidase YcbB/YkuD
MAFARTRLTAAWHWPTCALLLIGTCASAHDPVSATPPAVVTQAPRGAPPAPREVVDAIRTRLARAADAEVRRLYAPVGDSPVWVDGTGRPSRDADAALQLLAGAGADGLAPETYQHASLSRQAATLREAPAVVADDVARFDLDLTRHVLRYVRHLHTGRIDPRTIGFNLVVPPEPHDFADAVRTALAQQRVAHLREDWAPRLLQYDALRAALARYRTLAAAAALANPPPATPPVRPGEIYPHLERLHARLAALGDVDADAATTNEGVYDEPLVAAVQRFQARHGLEPDGIIGRATQAALQVPLTWRVRQIELALERLRWLPDLDERRVVLVNIPMFHLWGWDATTPGTPPVVAMRAIVGRALDTQTPVFVADMAQVVFRPYWNVPRSILLNELLPKIRRDARYLDREALEIVRGGGDNAARVPLSADALAGLRNGTLRLRQRPGPRNALGRVKFLFPNSNDVYMHDTPTQSLFSRARRDFSHGCVRVEDPFSLAVWALQEQPEWTRGRIEEAMAAAGGPLAVALTRPIRVMIFYTTAAVTPRDGAVHFVPDIYRHDARLDAALRTMGATQ